METTTTTTTMMMCVSVTTSPPERGRRQDRETKGSSLIGGRTSRLPAESSFRSLFRFGDSPGNRGPRERETDRGGAIEEERDRQLGAAEGSDKNPRANFALTLLQWSREHLACKKPRVL